MSGNERRLLLIAHAFPPAGGGGVQRAAKFSKYLSRMGWRVTVVTTQAEFYQEHFGLHDVSLSEDVPSEVEVLRVVDHGVSVVPPRRLGLPGLDRLRHELYLTRRGADESWAWCQDAYPRLVREPGRARWSVVMATGNPFSSFLLARMLSRRMGVPYILDLRDPWCQRDWPRDWRAGWRQHRWERVAVSSAAFVLCVTDRMRDLYKEAYPRMAGRFITIENGVDIEETSGVEPVRISAERFEVVHTGNFNRKTAPDIFLRGFAKARKRSAGFDRAARFITAGRVTRREERVVAELGLGDRVSIKGVLPHPDVLRLQRGAGALVLCVADSLLVACGKSYEYLASGRPVLALVSRGGEAARVLGRSALTEFGEPDDPEDVARRLLGLYERWRRGELNDLPVPQVPREYTRAYQAEQLAGVLDAACAGSVS